MPDTVTTVRPIYEIAREIRKDWTKVNYAAVPYLEAMFMLDKITDAYYSDSGREIVQRFISNSGAWRGEVAKRVKAELRGMVAK